jgi:hypothetical protein
MNFVWTCENIEFKFWCIIYNLDFLLNAVCFDEKQHIPIL